MERQIDMSEVSDGRLYHHGDLVRCDSHGCKNCVQCCTTMGDTIILDPYDANAMMKGLSCSFDALLNRQLTLRLVDGLILPGIHPDERGACGFLDTQGMCIIHDFRPGFCRLFPLGRIYDAKTRTFSYYMQTKECPYPNKTKVKVEKWLGIAPIEAYETYIVQWHFLTRDLWEILKNTQDETIQKNMSMAVLNLFYRKPYGEDFYTEFTQRWMQLKEITGIQ